MYHHIDELIDSIVVRTAHKADLSRIQEFLKRHGDPQDKLRCIHIAGTNGKGSTTNYLRSILQSAGYQVGTFTSPHLEKHQDRIRINDKCIDDETFLAYGNLYDEEWLDHGLNMFEIDMFISLLYFQEKQVDFAIYEVGMGGRLDATNVITPLLSIITNIGMDHMQYLGDSYELIAKEKAGIIKPGVPLLTGEDKEVCLQVFAAVCQTQQSPMIKTQRPANLSVSPIHFTYRDYVDLQLGNVAIYQWKNACLALEAIYQMHQHKWIDVSLSQIQKGLLTIWRGRFEQMLLHPLTYVDGAHNQEGIHALCETLANYPQKKSIVFCAMKDKPVNAMLEELFKQSEDITLTEFDFPRVFRVNDFDGSLPIKINPLYTSAIDEALQNKDHMVIITGSLYFISEAREYLIKKGNHCHVDH